MTVSAKENARRRLRGENVRRLRAEVLQRDLADALGWSQARLSELENGCRPLTLRTIEALAEIYGMPPWQMLKEIDSV